MTPQGKREISYEAKKEKKETEMRKWLCSSQAEKDVRENRHG